MRDPYPLARLSGIVALANTDRFYTLRDIASKVLPNLCMLTIDPEKDVRDEAFKTIKLYTQKLEKVSENPELALEMEKDVSSCTLDVKNETSWTSWAMTSLSAKMTGYKNKSQQPSVALNTQPLAAPTSLAPVKETESAKTSPEKETKHEPKVPIKQPIKPEEKVTKVETNENYTSDWGMDDNDWKDIDDDEQMESLEPASSFNAQPFVAGTPVKTGSSNEPIKSTSNQNNDWSDWSNSFENIEPKKTPTLKTNKPAASSGAQLAPTSSYNWTSQNSSSSFLNQNNEEDLFSSLVKDISINKVL